MAEEGRATELLLLLTAALAAAIAFYPSLALTEWGLDDADPLSYAAVVPLMLAIQIVFFDAGAVARPDWKGVLAATLLFLASAAVMLLAPSAFSLGFWFYRFDFLSLALFFTGGVILLFGWEGVRPLKFMLAYSFLAWPAIFLPLTWLGPFLLSATAAIVQAVTVLLGLAVSREPGNIFTSLTSEVPVIIAPQCVALAAFLGFIAFMLPLAYFSVGKAKGKAAWLMGGALAVMLLNVLRITGVILVWYHQGISDAVAVFHSVSGNVMFNAAILLALLVMPKFGLSLPLLRGAPLIREGTRALGKWGAELRSRLPAFAALFFALALSAYAFRGLDSRIGEYSWLASFEGKTFTAFQVASGSLPMPEGWELAGSEVGNGEGVFVTRAVFESANRSQAQLVFYSSGSSDALSLSPAAKLAEENYSISSSGRAALGNGIYAGILHYSRNGTKFTSVHWAQPAKDSGRYTYATIILTSAGDFGEARDAELVAAGARLSRYFQ